MTTVVPVRLMRSRSLTISRLVAGSRLPVGSSARRIGGRLTKARAMATRCCSPPESWCGRRFSLPARPTSSRVSGTVWRILLRLAPMTWRA
jgi:hypothetical protein